MRPFAYGVITLALTAGVVACSSDDPVGAPSTTVAPPATDPTTAPSATEPPTSDPGTSDPGTSDAPVRPELAVGPSVLQLEELVDLAVRPGDERLFLVERAGRVTIAEGDSSGVSVVGEALDMSDLTENQGEQGLLGLAFAPDGATAYVNYTDNDGNTVIDGYTVADDGTFSDRREVITIDQPYPNHNGGDVAFGPDGLLYIGMGDGGAADDPERRALDTGELLGKMLRIDPTASGDQGYTVPDDNPLVDVDGARPEIWAVGVRNPWRFSFDPATGDLWIADVGQNEWEEITRLPATDGVDAGRGNSLGWSAIEGDVAFNDDVDATDPLGGAPVAPLHVYQHGDDGCSISGGEVYRGSGITGLDGWYVFGDFCSGKVWALEPLADGGVGEVREIGNVAGLTAIVADPSGELWALSIDGSMYPVVPA